MRNPFQYGAELKPSQIVNRKQELRDARRAILEHARLFLLGPRRFGKTAILRAATSEAERDGAIVIQLDAEAYPGMDGLVQAIVTESARKLKGDVAQAGEKILRFFPGCDLRSVMTRATIAGRAHWMRSRAAKGTIPL